MKQTKRPWTAGDIADLLSVIAMIIYMITTCVNCQMGMQ